MGSLHNFCLNLWLHMSRNNMLTSSNLNEVFCFFYSRSPHHMSLDERTVTLGTTISRWNPIHDSDGDLPHSKIGQPFETLLQSWSVISGHQALQWLFSCACDSVQPLNTTAWQTFKRLFRDSIFGENRLCFMSSQQQSSIPSARLLHIIDREHLPIHTVCIFIDKICFTLQGKQLFYICFIESRSLDTPLSQGEIKFRNTLLQTTWQNRSSLRSCKFWRCTNIQSLPSHLILREFISKNIAMTLWWFNCLSISDP
jgi:hypothetical protein